MKKTMIFALLFVCAAGSINAAGYRSRGRGSRGDSYTHSVGGIVGNMFGASYKGFIFGVDGLALQADLAVKLQDSPCKSVIEWKEQNLKESFTGNIFNYTFELNPNLLYQKEVAQLGRNCSFAVYGGGGVSLGLIKEHIILSVWSSPMGKFGVNGMAGFEFIWPRLALSFDFRPGYGMIFDDTASKDKEIKQDLTHFFDYGIAVGLRYCL